MREMLIVENRYTKKGKRSYDVLGDERTKRRVNNEQPLSDRVD